MHSWTASVKFHMCEHEPDIERAWLKPGSPAHKALQAIVTDRTLLKDMKQLTKFCHTGNLEVYHNVLLKYVPKRISFSYEGNVARTMLAALDNNLNVDRIQAMTKGGVPRWKMQYSKASKSYIVKKITVAKKYSFRDSLMDAVIDLVEEGVVACQKDCIEVPELANRSIGSEEKPSKEEAISNRVSRFRN